MADYSRRLLPGIGLVLGVSIAAFLHTSNVGAAKSPWWHPGSRPIAESVTDPCLGQIAFASFRDLSGRGEIYLMNTDGSSQTALTDNNALDNLPSWSPDGLDIAFQSDRDNLQNGRPDIYVMDASGGNVRRLTTNPAFDESPAWAPDGARLAFVSTRDDPDNNIRQLYVMNSDGSGQTRLTFGDSIQPLLTWSPDSSKIAFSAPVGGGLPPDILRIYTINAGGGAPSALTNPSVPETDITPAWSPDGKQLAFARLRSGEDHSDVYVINAQTGGEMKNLTGTPGANNSPAWSPDGSAIAFVSTRDGHREIYVMYPDGSGQTDLTHNPAHDQNPAWRPAPEAAPCLLADVASQRGAALESVNFLRDPFSVTTSSNFSRDHHTRLSLFARNITFLPGENPPVVTAQAEDAQNAVYPLEVEFVGQVPNLSWLTQVNVRLPDTLPDSGDLSFSVTAEGNQSNKIVVKIAPLTANLH